MVRCLAGLIFWGVVFGVLGVDGAGAGEAVDYRVVDGFSYSSGTARRLWEPMEGSGAVSVVRLGGRNALRMPVDFSGTKIDRASWDRSIKLDMSMADGLSFLFHSEDTSPISGFTVYFRSGKGWYRGTFDGPVSKGWTPIRIHKKTAGTEGEPSGWGDVDAIRISAWRGGERDTEFYIAALGLFGGEGKVVVVRADSEGGKGAEAARGIAKYTEVLAGFLERGGFDYVVISDRDVTADRLAGREVVVLPYNPQVPANAVAEIKKFLVGGGKMVACYHLPAGLEKAVGIRSGSYVGGKPKGYFASIRPSGKVLKGFPRVVKQGSWNINEARAVPGRSRVAAWWYNDRGENTGHAAVVASDNCVYFSHIVIADDPANKRGMVLSMIGNLAPGLWRDAAEMRLAEAGQVGPYEDFESAASRMRREAVGNAAAEAVLRQAISLRRKGQLLVGDGKYSEALVAADELGEAMLEAYCLVQEPQAGEHRAWWCHSAFGVEGMTWDAAIKNLAENGFTAVLPNMLWGGVAYYDSDVLPVHKDVAAKGDQIEHCLAACRKYGVECHVWKVNFNMGWAADRGFMRRMKNAGRTQVSFEGAENERWLCPSHPENQKLEVAAMLEVAHKFDVDGIHFDYIRYPGSDNCFCEGCRGRFEAYCGRKVRDWPACVRGDDKLHEKWLDFRREQITKVVAEVASRARRIRPGIEISAAVFRNWPSHRDTVGQDWKLWCERGYMDFVCPMDYTAQSGYFRQMIRKQKQWAAGVPVYPGIGLSVWPDRTDVEKLIEQIKMTREAGMGGFTIFNYSAVEAEEVAPMLGKGMTKTSKK